MKRITWRKRFPELSRRLNAAQRDANKRVLGRSCRSCGVSDDEATFAIGLLFCKKCHERGRRNGFCDSCHLAKFVVAGKGHVAERPCRCPLPVESQLWDALRWHDPRDPITLDLLAERFGQVKRNVERKKDAILATCRRYDPGAAWGVEAFSPRVVLVVDLRRVQRGLENLCGAEALA